MSQADQPDSMPPNSGVDNNKNLMQRARDIFFEVRELGPSRRDEEIDLMCGGRVELKNMVRMLLRGDQAPLPYESLADDIRAAHDSRPTSVPTLEGSTSSVPTDRIGNYRVLERLGEGGFGVVYLAEQEKPVRRRVALKIIKPGMDTRQVVARFEAERQALALMDHPGIAKVFDAGSTETGRPFFVMELVKGLAITEYCDLKKLDVRERLALMMQVCEAMHHAHQRGVIHRDIKPSNVLVTEVGGKATPKIIDFGIAKATGGRLTERTIFTEFRQMIGTPEYMSPEQAGEVADDVDTRTDVYAAGVLLYELLTGTTPFDSQRLRSAAYGEMQRIIREEDPPKPSTKVRTRGDMLGSVALLRSMPSSKLMSAIKGELDCIVMKAIEKDRTRRYDSAVSLSEDIQRYLTGHAVKAAPPGRVYQMTKFIRRNKGVVTAVMLVAFTLIGGLLGTSLGYFNAKQQREVAVKERDRADSNAAEARIAEGVATGRSYIANMMSASGAINNLQYADARDFLEAAPQGLRGWEWRTLKERLDTSARTVATSMARPTSISNSTLNIMMSPDGSSFYIAHAENDSVASRWDYHTGKLLTIYSPSIRSKLRILSSISVSRDGSRISTSPSLLLAGDNTFRVESWDVVTGRSVLQADVPRPYAGTIRTAVFEDATRVIVYDSSRVAILSVPSGQVLVEKSSEGVPHYGCVLSTDERLIAEFGTYRMPSMVPIRDTQTLEPVAVLKGHQGMVINAAFSDDARWVGTAADDSTARIWDLSATPPSSLVLDHPIRVSNIRFSPDGVRVATICHDRTIRIWDRETGRLLEAYPGENLVPNPLMFLDDGNSIAGLDQDGTLRVWDLIAESTKVLQGHTSIVSSGRYVKGNPAGLIVTSGWDGLGGATGENASESTVRIWDAETGEAVGVIRGLLGDIVYFMAVSNGGRYAAIQSAHLESVSKYYEETGTGQASVPLGRTEVVDLSTGRRVFTTESPLIPNWVGFGSDDYSLTAVYRNPSYFTALQVHVLDVRTGNILVSRELDSDSYWRFSGTTDGRWIAAVSSSEPIDTSGHMLSKILILDARTLETVREFEGVSGIQMCVAFNHDGSRIATGNNDGAVNVYETSTGKHLARMPGHGAVVLSVGFNPDGKRIVSGGLDGSIGVWDTKTYQRVAKFAGHQGHVGFLDWDESGERLLSSSGDMTARIWEPFPIRTRIKAREERKRVMKEVEPMVNALLGALHDPNDAAEVVERIKADPSLSPLARKVALQLVLRKGLEAQAAMDVKAGVSENK